MFCKTCRYWEANGRDAYEDEGRCRRYAPRPLLLGDRIDWPLTSSSDWCGEFALHDVPPPSGRASDERG